MSRILTPPVASRWSSTHMQGTVQPRVQSPPWQAGLHGASTDECRSRAHRNCSQRAASLECRQPGPVGALQDRLVPGCRRQDDRIARVQRARAHRSDAPCHGVETCRNRLGSRTGYAVHAWRQCLEDRGLQRCHRRWGDRRRTWLSLQRSAIRLVTTMSRSWSMRSWILWARSASGPQQTTATSL